MGQEPIPHRIPALSWRKPTWLWTPIALALAIGWPVVLFQQNAAPQRFVLIAGAAVFAVALITLGASWALGRAPRTRREVVLHVVLAGALMCLVSPFLLTQLLAAVADYERAGAAESFNLTMTMAMIPVALIVGLPISLISGIVFSFVAMTRLDPWTPPDDDVFSRRDVQPFR
jgi:hypothetical protein